MAHDHLHCPGSICAGDPNPKFESEVTWFPGEPVCRMSPSTVWQKRQRQINRWFAKGEFKYGDRFYFTANTLKKGASVRKGRKGKDPNCGYRV